MSMYSNIEIPFLGGTSIILNMKDGPFGTKIYNKNINKDFFQKIELKVWDDSLDPEGYRKISRVKIGVTISHFSQEEKELYRMISRHRSTNIKIREFGPAPLAPTRVGGRQKPEKIPADAGTFHVLRKLT